MNTFFRWLDEYNKANNKKISISSKKELLFRQLKKIWETSTEFSMPELTNTDEEWQKLERAISSVNTNSCAANIKPAWRKSSFSKYAILYASIALLIIVSIYMFYQFRTIQYSTHNKEKISIILSDSTRVILNCASKFTLHKQFNKKKREVSLTGEAYFDVRKGEFPFIIKTDVIDIKVLGTQFNVKSCNVRTEVAVNSGTVEVAAKVGCIDSTVTLTSGQYSLCQTGSFPEAPQKIRFDSYPGWIHGYLPFNKTELKYDCVDLLP